MMIYYIRNFVNFLISTKIKIEYYNSYYYFFNKIMNDLFIEDLKKWTAGSIKMIIINLKKINFT